MIPLKDHNPTTITPFVTFALVAINTLVMLYMAALPPDSQQQFVIENGFVPARWGQLSDPNLVIRVPIQAEVDLPNGQIVRKTVDEVELPPSGGAVLLSIFTCMFMHGGWMHLAGNMWFLWIFGNNIEDRLGHVLYLLFYLLGGILATFCHWAYDPASTMPVVGASGAVSTILGAYAVTFPKHTVSTLIFFGIITIIEIPSLVWLALWFGGQVVSAVAGRDLGVAVWAHIGGFAVGAIGMPLLARVTDAIRRDQPRQDEFEHHYRPFDER